MGEVDRIDFAVNLCTTKIQGIKEHYERFLEEKFSELIELSDYDEPEVMDAFDPDERKWLGRHAIVVHLCDRITDYANSCFGAIRLMADESPQAALSTAQHVEDAIILFEKYYYATIRIPPEKLN